MIRNRVILTGEKEIVANWVFDRTEAGPNMRDAVMGGWYCTLATIDLDTNEIYGACVYSAWTKGEKTVSMELTASGGPLWLSRKLIRAYFSLPFIHYGCTRLTTIVSKKNKKSREMQRRLGFVEEGNAREGMSNGDDAIIYGLLKRECRWIR